MSVKIEGMKMPNGWKPDHCDNCPFYTDAVFYSFCQARKWANLYGTTDLSCPVSETDDNEEVD